MLIDIPSMESKVLKVYCTFHYSIMRPGSNQVYLFSVDIKAKVGIVRSHTVRFTKDFFPENKDFQFVKIHSSI